MSRQRQNAAQIIEEESEVSEAEANAAENAKPIAFPKEELVNRLGKYAGAIGGILALIGSLFAVQGLLTSSIEAIETASKAYVDIELAKHSAHPHADSVPRELFDEHVRAQRAATARNEKTLDKVLIKLDALGEREYQSAHKWKKEVEARAREVHEPPTHLP